ncbi:lysoplasmalogenase [Ideonella sp.]|uniref:lysoplasmalogenase n=1 Tax=Ideonella sp. TaxID=1929293 RepID=UPI0035AE8910
MSRAAWLAAAAVSAVAAIAAEMWGLRGLFMVLKPLTTALLIAWAWPRGAGEPLRQAALRAGLVLSWLGDVALLWPREGFLPGLVAFLLAHLAYLVVFGRSRPAAHGASRWAPFIAYAAVAAGVLAHLWPGVPAALRAPVMAYVAALGSMAALSAGAWLAARGTPAHAAARLGAVGGLLFLLSDALLATHRFAGPVPMAGVGILATYWVAQAAIAASLAAPAPASAPAHGAVSAA